MNEMNLPENRLRSWRPRRASAGLKHRIFVAPAATTPSRALVWSMRCLAPAAACWLFAMAVLHHSGGIAASASNNQFMVGMIGSNQFAYLPTGRYRHDHNTVVRTTFDWTNVSGSTSSISSVLPGRVN